MLPSEEELARTCGKTLALVLARSFETTPLQISFEDESKEKVVCGEVEKDEPGTPRPLQRFKGRCVTSIAVKHAQEARFASVEVLAGGTQSEREELARTIAADLATDAAESHSADTSDKSHGALSTRAIPYIVAYDTRRAYQSTVDAHGFTLYDLPKGLLDYAAEALERTPQADSVMLLSCDEVRITPAHLYEVCRAFRQSPTLDVTASWIQWYRRTPMVISRNFLARLAESGFTAPSPNGHDRPLPHISVKDVLFGEETLAANPIVPAKLSAFEKEHTLSAREAVCLAREELKRRDENSRKDDRRGAETGKVAPSPKRAPADRELLEAALAVVERMNAWRSRLSESDQEKLSWADAWAKRNREDFPLLNDCAQKHSLAYLDSAATTQRCFRAINAEETFNRHENANIYRGGYELSTHATKYFNDARKVLEDFIGAKRRQTVYTMNTSASCNLVATAWGDRNVSEGDTIAVALSEHHSDMLPWLALARRRGAALEFIPYLPDGRIDMAAYREILKKNPKLVCVAQVSNILGIVNPVESMCRQAHEAGARFLVDAAQSAPHLPFNVQKIGCDFAAFSAHKMYGPLGIGGLYISDDAFEEMDPVSLGGGVVSHASSDSYYLRQGAIQYEVGTPPIAQAIGWAGAIEYLNELGMNAVYDHAKAITPFCIHALHGVEGLTVWGDHSAPDGAGGLVAFSLPNVGPAQIGTFCGMLGVAVRSGGHCAIPLTANIGMGGTGRASFAVHTTLEDIEALAVSVELCRRMYL